MLFVVVVVVKISENYFIHQQQLHQMIGRSAKDIVFLFFFFAVTIVIFSNFYCKIKEEKLKNNHFRNESFICNPKYLTKKKKKKLGQLINSNNKMIID